MRGKHRAYIGRVRGQYDRRIRRSAELACLIRGHQWVPTAMDFLATKVRYTDRCRHCGRTRHQLVEEH